MAYSSEYQLVSVLDFARYIKDRVVIVVLYLFIGRNKYQELTPIRVRTEQEYRHAESHSQQVIQKEARNGRERETTANVVWQVVP